MKGLLIKDILIMRNQRSSALLILLMGIMMSVYMQSSAVIGYLMMMGGMLSLSTMSYDEHENGFRYLFSLPVTRKEYVKEKYLFCIAWVILCMICGSLACYVIMAFRKQIDMTELFGTCVTMFCTIVVFLAISIYARIRYGNEKSRIIIYIFFGGIGLIGFVLSKLVSPENVMAIEQFVSTNGTALMVVLPIVSLIVYLISYLISVGCTEKKEF